MQPLGAVMLSTLHCQIISTFLSKNMFGFQAKGPMNLSQNEWLTWQIGVTDDSILVHLPPHLPMSVKGPLSQDSV